MDFHPSDNSSKKEGIIIKHHNQHLGEYVMQILGGKITVLQFEKEEETYNQSPLN